jgi:hypothetical protein
MASQLLAVWKVPRSDHKFCARKVQLKLGSIVPLSISASKPGLGSWNIA